MPSERQPRWNTIDLLLATASLLTFLYAWVFYPISQRHRGDFFALLSHRDDPSPYWDGNGIGYGPIFALYDLMLRPFHDVAAMRIMYGINLILLGAAFVIFLRCFMPAPRQRRETLVALFVWVSFYPLAQLIRQNNIEITELFFLSLFLLYSARREPNRAGLALGLATSAKLVPIFAIPYLAWRRQWKTCAVAIATLVVLVVAVSAIKGLNPASAVDNWHHAATVKWPNEWNNNQAFSGFFWRLFSVADFQNQTTASYPRVLHADWAFLATALTAAAAMLSTAAVFIRRCGLWPRPSANSHLEITEFAIVFTVILLCLPHSHTHYFGLIVWIYFVGMRALNRDRLALSSRSQWLFVISFLAAGMLLPLRLADPVVRTRLPVSLIEISKLYSVPMLGIVTGVLALFAVHYQYVARLRNQTSDGNLVNQ